jgi:hypothetical protein
VITNYTTTPSSSARRSTHRFSASMGDTDEFIHKYDFQEAFDKMVDMMTKLGNKINTKVATLRTSVKNFQHSY